MNHPADNRIINIIHSHIEKELERLGLFHRIFSRVKSDKSVERKLMDKRHSYIEENRKMQDTFGLRIALYFMDDIEIARMAVSNLFNEKTKDNSIDTLQDEKFGPVKYNVIYTLPEEMSRNSYIINSNELLDNTFEIQYRTVLSEGWHEVEHDMRYKCKADWQNYKNQSRALNGIYATLENSDLSMIRIFDEISYNNFKKREWNSLIRNNLRIRFSNDNLSDDIINFLNSNNTYGKAILNIDRKFFLEQIIRSNYDLPLIYDNLFFLINRLILKEERVHQLESDTLKSYFDMMNIL